MKHGSSGSTSHLAMNAFYRSLLIAACLNGAGCSALSDFSGYEFSGPDHDGGMDRDDSGAGHGGSGEGGESGEGSSGEGGESGEGSSGEGGESGEGSSGEGGESGTNSGGSGGESGDGGDGGDAAVDPECTEDTVGDDCEETEMCVNEMCVPIRIPSGVLQSAGGGDISSASYLMRISIGAPQPMGRVSSTNFIVTVGPAAGRP